MMERAAKRGHRPIDHTGDVAIELWAPTEQALLDEAGRAAVEIMTGQPAPPRAEAAEPGAVARPAPAGGREVRDVKLDTIDSEDRLVQWINEVIYLAVHEGLVAVCADIELGDEPGVGLVARVSAEPIGDRVLATELKSATYHDLRVERDDDGLWRARVVIDV